MANKKLTTTDKITIIGLIVNAVIVVGLAIWNTTMTERLAKLEYQDYAPHLRVTKTSSASNGYYLMTLAIKNTGVHDIENIHLAIDSYILYPLRSCYIRLPQENTEPKIVNDVSRVFVLYTFSTISPSETIFIDCSSPSVLAYYENSNLSISPFEVEDEKCLPKFPDHPEYSSALPKIQVTGKNLTFIDYECTSLPESRTP